MVISMRHFVITIIAIFLSLGVGILIGALMDSQQLFIDQQKELVMQIEEEFDGFKQKNYELMNKIELYKGKIEKNDKFVNNIYDFLISDRLEGLNILFLKIYDDNQYLDVENTLKDSGINRILKLSIIDESKLDSYEVVKQLKDKFNIEGNDIDEIRRNTIRKLFKEICSNKYSDLSYYLKEKEIIDCDRDIFTNFDYVIVADDSFEKNGKLQKGKDSNSIIIEMLKASNIPMIAIERSDKKVSSISYYKEKGISSVDNINTKYGKIAMIMVMSGKNGTYGEKESAEDLVPSGFLLTE